MTESEITVADVPDLQRYEIHVDGELAGFAEYRGRHRVRAFVHTEIDPGFEGRGLGSRLIRESLDDARENQHTVVPMCPFVHKFIAEHPDYLDLVEPHIQKAFHLA